MQPSSFPASIGDAAIVSAASARADHSHVPQDIAGFHDSVAEIALGGRVIEFSGTIKDGVSVCYEGDPFEQGIYAMTIEHSVSVDVPVPDSEAYSIGKLSFLCPNDLTVWIVNADTPSTGNEAVKAGTGVVVTTDKSVLSKTVVGLLFVKSRVEFGGVSEPKKMRLYVIGDEASSRGGRNTTATTRIKLRNLM